MQGKKSTDEPIIYDNEIDMWLDEFKTAQGFDDFRTIPQTVWTAALIFVQRHLFPDTKILKIKSPITVSNRHINDMYMYDVLDAICNHYIFLCYLYDKEITISGFCHLTGIEMSSVLSWGRGESLSSTALMICKRLRDGREESLAARMVTGRQNPVGILSILNHFYGWAQPGVTHEVAKPALTADQLPRLDAKCTPDADIIYMK